MKNKLKTFSIVDKGLSIDGTVKTNGHLIIKGTLRGKLEGDSVAIAEDGAVFAETKVNSISIGGKFEGSIHAAEEIVILSSGTCSGKAVCKKLVVESGGILNADVSCIVTESNPPKPEVKTPELKLTATK